MSALEDLSSSGHGYLPGGAYYVSYQKRTLKKKIYIYIYIPTRKIKYGSQGSISNVDLGLF